VASGITEKMILFSRSLEWYPKPENVRKERDRSLSGKARKRARREARRG
jgi:hypothetical protein